MPERVTRFLVEAERESEQDLIVLIERLASTTSSMTRYQELSALLEVSTILAHMSHSSVDEVFRKLSPLSKSHFREEAGNDWESSRHGNPDRGRVESSPWAYGQGKGRKRGWESSCHGHTVSSPVD